VPPRSRCTFRSIQFFLNINSIPLK
jgi:hypothetical protein